MSAWTWAALAFFLVVLVCGSGVVGWLGFRFWRRLRDTMAATSTSVDGLATEMQALDRRLQGMQGRAEELQDAAARLSGTLARAGVLLRSAQESRDAIGGWLRFVPRA